MELCSGEGSRSEGSLVMKVLKGFHGPLNMREGTYRVSRHPPRAGAGELAGGRAPQPPVVEPCRLSE